MMMKFINQPVWLTLRRLIDCIQNRSKNRLKLQRFHSPWHQEYNEFCTCNNCTIHAFLPYITHYNLTGTSPSNQCVKLPQWPYHTIWQGQNFHPNISAFGAPFRTRFRPNYFLQKALQSLQFLHPNPCWLQRVAAPKSTSRRAAWLLTPDAKPN